MASDDLKIIFDRIASLPQEATETLIRSIAVIEAYYSTDEDHALTSNFSA
jgi:hypothetical protein